MATVKKSSTKTSTPSKQIGLNQKQVSQLRGMKGIDQKALSAYEASGSVVGGRNNPRGRGRENVPVITPERVAPTEVAEIPTLKAPTTDFSSILSMGNAGLVDPQTGLTQQKGQFVYDPNKSAAVNAAEEANMGNQGTLAAIAQYLRPKENELSDTYAQMEKKAGIQGLQKEVGAFSSQLNAITSSRDAEMLKLEGQGRGQTQGFIGGEQARINREAAIQALPVQAQLAAAQGNLEMAQSRVNTLFQIKSQDIAAQNAYKTNLANSVMQYANAAQQNILNAKLGDIEKQEQREQQALADAKNIAMQAIEYGQSSLAARIMGLDPKSKTYQQDVNAAMGQLRKPVAATTKRDTAFDKDGNLVDMQTGELIRQGGGLEVPGSPDAVQKSIDQLSFLRNTAKDALANAENSGIFRTPVGPSAITRLTGDLLIGNTSFRQLQNQTDTLKTNVLSLMTDPNVKKFFGPQMSNADVRLMSSTGSTLDPQTQSKTEYVAEIKRLDDLFNRMETAVKTGIANETGVAGGNVITAPDGNLIEIID